MKLQIKTSLLVLGLLATFAPQLPTLYAQGTAFTYQGRLTEGGQAANGRYDLKFAAFDVPEYGFPVGPLITNTAMAVSGGLFTAELDFGTDVFNGGARWLEIAVRTNGGGAFVPLSPRQKLTPAPYAILASNVSGTVAAANIDTAVARDTEILPTVLANDGSGSGLNADLLDGLNSTAFATAAHDHYGSSWSGAATKGLSVQTDATGPGRAALFGREGTGAGTVFSRAAGVWGDSTNGYGVLGSSYDRIGVLGYAGSSTGQTSGVRGESASASGSGVYGLAFAPSGTNYGVYGYTASIAGAGVCGYAPGGGGAAIRASGSGVIQSTADSYVFVPGCALVKNLNTDTTRWDIQANGAALIWRGAAAGTKTVYFPISLPALLYGQPVTLESVTVYYRCQNGTNNFIDFTDLNRQTDADSWVDIANDNTDYKSNTASSYTLVTSVNSRLSATQGVLGLYMYLAFANDTEYVQIGGIRLRLSHQ